MAAASVRSVVDVSAAALPGATALRARTWSVMSESRGETTRETPPWKSAGSW